MELWKEETADADHATGTESDIEEQLEAAMPLLRQGRPEGGQGAVRLLCVGHAQPAGPGSRASDMAAVDSRHRQRCLGLAEGQRTDHPAGIPVRAATDSQQGRTADTGATSRTAASD